ncbi:MAG TPA: PaaR repeat-containing protein [Thermosulfurimonas dismutans]|uniref:PaaR repeat-containing protein n=1 Tax=Thermosulfurimonas dismutans TaxID=999894 RepID=A0A7C3CQL7_9BACT|nr:PaaR repeat-containing protein [Thermosulfurimonas dismutans]
MFLARWTDLSTHGGTLLPPGAIQVLAGGLPVAFLGSNHVCPLPFHPPGALLATGTRLLVQGWPAGRVQDPLPCGAQVLTGEFTILVGG